MANVEQNMNVSILKNIHCIWIGDERKSHSDWTGSKIQDEAHQFCMINFWQMKKAKENEGMK